MKHALSRYSVLLRMLIVSLQFFTVAHAADNFGRLFTTPSERANLDYLRQTTKASAIKEPAEPSIDAVAPTAPVIPEAISMQGYVKRSDGKKGTVWVNHKPLQEDSSSDAVEVGRLGAGNQVQLKMPSTGKHIHLKAGQVYLPETGAVSEVNAHGNSKKELSGTIDSDSMQDSPSSVLPSKTDGLGR